MVAISTMTSTFALSPIIRWNPMTTIAREPNPDLVAMNRWNEKYWEGQRLERNRRMKDPAILATAVADITSELGRNVPVPVQKIFEAALADAEAAKQRFISQQARTAGYAKKTDPLQEIVEQAVRENQAITEAELNRLIKNHVGVEPIQEIEGGIIFITKANGTTKEVPLSGFKHRLSRAKKKFGKT
jgi:hypothetical protein